MALDPQTHRSTQGVIAPRTPPGIPFLHVSDGNQMPNTGSLRTHIQTIAGGREAGLEGRTLGIPHLSVLENSPGFSNTVRTYFFFCTLYYRIKSHLSWSPGRGL